MKKKGAVRWVIKADGQVVDIVYTSERKAWILASRYEEECAYQDDPFSPHMTVEEEYMDPDED